MTEIWIDIEGYEGLYQISNLGRVKRLEKIIERIDGRIVKYKEKICKTHKRSGYHRVCITKEKYKTVFLTVHKLVANAFLKKKNNKPFVNHIDGNKDNNFLSNLEWCDYSENNLHSYKNGLNNGAYG